MKATPPATPPAGRATLPPRWFVRSAWAAHRGLLKVTHDRVGLSRPTPGGRFGMLRLRTTGRRTGQERAVVLGYVEDGDRLVTLAMNGWDAADPAWWLNLQADPTATVDLVDGSRRIVAREATDAERDPIRAKFLEVWPVLEVYESRTSRRIPFVMLEPRSS